MQTWADGLWSEAPSYAGVRLREGNLEEVDAQHVLVSVPVEQIQRLRLEHGIAAERPHVQLALGGAMLAAGAWGALASGHALLQGQRGVSLVLAATFVAGLGLALLLTRRRRTFYLLAELASDRRKLSFGAAAEPRALSIFLAQLQKRSGLSVYVPTELRARSRFATGEVPAGLRSIIREVSGRGVRSFTLCGRDDSLFTVLVEPLADWLASYLEGGADVRDRQTIQLGSQLFLVELNDAQLTLLAPAGGPEQWQVDLTSELLTAYRQRELVASFGVESAPPSPLALVSIEEEAARGGAVVLHRLAPDADAAKLNHSGWYVAALRERDAADEPPTLHVTVRDVAELRPDLMEFLALSPLSSVVLQASGFEVQQGDVTLTPAPESYAHAKQHGVELPEHLKGSTWVNVIPP